MDERMDTVGAESMDRILGEEASPPTLLRSIFRTSTPSTIVSKSPTLIPPWICGWGGGDGEGAEPMTSVPRRTLGFQAQLHWNQAKTHSCQGNVAVI